MKIIQASYEILHRDNIRGDMPMIELAARTCYKSETKDSVGSAERMTRQLIKSGHLSAVEHGAYVFEVTNEGLFGVIVRGLMMLRLYTAEPPRILATRIDDRMIISGNCRAWREMVQLSENFVDGAGVVQYFIPYIDRAYIDDLCDVTNYGADERIVQLYDVDLAGDPVNAMFHLRQTVRFIVDRGVSHEFVRHRVLSYSQESTRYCNYSGDKFGNEITVIEPCFFEPDTTLYELWRRACMTAEIEYMTMLRNGATPEQARDVLPTSVKTELIMTGTLAQWGHFFDLRAKQITGKAHPQAVEVALPLMHEMDGRFPAVFDVMSNA